MFWSFYFCSQMNCKVLNEWMYSLYCAFTLRICVKWFYSFTIQNAFITICMVHGKQGGVRFVFFMFWAEQLNYQCVISRFVTSLLSICACLLLFFIVCFLYQFSLHLSVWKSRIQYYGLLQAIITLEWMSFSLFSVTFLLHIFQAHRIHLFHFGSNML